MTVLVTGATGFVGAAVARRLLRAGARVRVLVRPGSDRRNLAGLAVEPVEGDLREGASLDRAVRGCETLFHVAADYRLWARRPEELFATNVAGTRALMHAAGSAGVRRVVYTSSVATLGFAGHRVPADEDTPCEFGDIIGAYKRSKFLAEEEVLRMAREQGLPAVVVNPSTPIGPGDVKPTPTGRLVVDAARGRIPAFVDTGLNVVHVDDVAEGHLLALDQGVVGRRYVLGGENLGLAQILAAIAEQAGRKPPRLKLPHGLALPVAYLSEVVAQITGRPPLATVDGVRMAKKHMYFSSARAERELGYRARPAEAAFADAVAWFAAAGYLGR
jgi:dihydroflavonol-4-reductase